MQIPDLTITKIHILVTLQQVQLDLLIIKTIYII